jgi:hypothetical protein
MVPALCPSAASPSTSENRQILLEIRLKDLPFLPLPQSVFNLHNVCASASAGWLQAQIAGHSMTVRSVSFALLVCLVGSVTTSSASTTMVRLGYANCTACHIAPQGAGLLTDYGKGIDVGQSLRASEYEPRNPGEPRILRYDVRLLTTGYMTQESPSGGKPTPPSWLRAYFRNSVALGARNRLASSVVMEAPGGNVSQLWETKPMLEVLGAWEYRPSDGFTLAVVRDRLPRGVEVGETKTILQDTDTDRYPSQVRAFLAKGILHVTAYGYAPGSEVAIDRRSHGFGVLGELQMFAGHVVLGASARHASDQSIKGQQAVDRQIFGGYARVGFGKWGVLAEHEFIDRTVSASQPWSPNRYAGYTQFFFVPKEWLVTSLIAEQAADDLAARPHTFRWRPEVQARLSSNVTITGSVRTDTTRGATGSGRIYLVQLALKTVQ